MLRGNVLVCGAGIAGLATALSLINKGFNDTVLESSSALGEIGAGVQIGPNAVKVLRSLGLEDRVAKASFEPDRHVARAWDSGRALFETQMKQSFEKKFGAPYYQVHRADLHSILSDALPDKVLRLNAECAKAETIGDRAVLTLRNGETYEADAIIGCDGIHSNVRSSLFGPLPPRFTGNICWRGLVPAAALPKGMILPDSTVWLGPRGHVVVYYVRGGELVNYVASYEAEEWNSESWSVEGDRTELMRMYEGWHPTLQTLFSNTARCYKWGLYDRDPLPRWSQGRVTLAGDSAHPMLPYLAQGACMALEDASAIAFFLSESPADVPGAIQRYEAVRRPRASRVQLTARARAKVNHLASPLSRLKRDVLLKWRKWRRPDSNTYDIDWVYAYDVSSPDQLRSDLRTAM